MKFLDKNLTLDAPVEFDVDAVWAEGAYLVVSYKWAGDKNIVDYDIIIVYLNDQGREVGRQLLKSTPEAFDVIPPKPVKRRFRVKNGFYLILEGMEEILKCLSAR